MYQTVKLNRPSIAMYSTTVRTDGISHRITYSWAVATFEVDTEQSKISEISVRHTNADSF